MIRVALVFLLCVVFIEGIPDGYDAIRQGYFVHYQCILQCYKKNFDLTYIYGEPCKGTVQFVTDDWGDVPFEWVEESIKCITSTCRPTIPPTVCEYSNAASSNNQNAQSINQNKGGSFIRQNNRLDSLANSQALSGNIFLDKSYNNGFSSFGESKASANTISAPQTNMNKQNNLNNMVNGKISDKKETSEKELYQQSLFASIMKGILQKRNAQQQNEPSYSINKYENNEDSTNACETTESDDNSTTDSTTETADDSTSTDETTTDDYSTTESTTSETTTADYSTTDSTTVGTTADYSTTESTPNETTDDYSTTKDTTDSPFAGSSTTVTNYERKYDENMDEIGQYNNISPKNSYFIPNRIGLYNNNQIYRGNYLGNQGSSFRPQTGNADNILDSTGLNYRGNRMNIQSEISQGNPHRYINQAPIIQQPSGYQRAQYVPPYPSNRTPSENREFSSISQSLTNINSAAVQGPISPTHQRLGNIPASQALYGNQRSNNLQSAAGLGLSSNQGLTNGHATKADQDLNWYQLFRELVKGPVAPINQRTGALSTSQSLSGNQRLGNLQTSGTSPNLSLNQGLGNKQSTADRTLYWIPGSGNRLLPFAGQTLYSSQTLRNAESAPADQILSGSLWSGNGQLPTAGKALYSNRVAGNDKSATEQVLPPNLRSENGQPLFADQDLHSNQMFRQNQGSGYAYSPVAGQNQN